MQIKTQLSTLYILQRMCLLMQYKSEKKKTTYFTKGQRITTCWEPESCKEFQFAWLCVGGYLNSWGLASSCTTLLIFQNCLYGLEPLSAGAILGGNVGANNTK